MSSICGIDAELIHEVAKIYASSSASIIFWGMGCHNMFMVQIMQEH